MRIMLKITMPHEKFNLAVQDGSAGPKMKRILEEVKPEAVYFSEDGGYRSCIMIAGLSDPSLIPALAEPWFLLFDAEVEFKVVMTPEDLAKAGLDTLGKKWAG